MIRKILTHPGGAHKDDVLAVCVLIAEHGAPVERRDPDASDLRDPGVAVVDIGGEHNPAMHNFDHHHFDRDHPPTCALSLVLAHLGLYEDALKLCDWLAPAEWFDSRGPNRTAEHLGVSRSVISQLNSPIDVTLLRRFAQKSELASGDPLYEYMRYVGADLLEYLRVSRQRMDFIAAHAQRWSLACREDVIEVVYVPRTDPALDEPSAAAAQYVRDQGLEATIAAIVYPDRRGGGFGITRYEDHPRLDFSRVAHEPDVRFAHKSGFMCKTEATEPERLRALICGAWV